MDSSLLWTVLGQNGPMTRSALADELGWPVRQVCVVLQVLNQNGLIDKTEPKSSDAIVEEASPLVVDPSQKPETVDEIFSDEPMYGRRRKRRKIIKQDKTSPEAIYCVAGSLNPFQISQANKIGLMTAQLEKFCKLDLTYARKIVASAKGFDKLAEAQKMKLLKESGEQRELKRKVQWKQKHPDLVFLLNVTNSVMAKTKEAKNSGSTFVLEQIKAGLEELVEHCRLQTSS